MDQDLYELMASLDPQSRDQLLRAVNADAQVGLAGHQMGIGNELLNTPTAEGRNVGRTYVASSPLEHMSVALRRGIGAQKMNQAGADQQAALGQRSTGLGAFLDLLGRKPNQQPLGGATGTAAFDDPSLYG